MSQSRQSRTKLLAVILIVLSLVVGVQVGVLFSRNIGPVRLGGAHIADLDAAGKADYTLLVAEAYAWDGDMERARTQLELLEVPNYAQWVANLTEQYIADGRDESDIVVLATLSHDLGVASPQVIAYLPTSTPAPTKTPSPTATPVTEATSTPMPTGTPTPTHTLVPPTDTPLPPTDTPPPSTNNTPTSAPTDTPLPPTSTPQPSPSPTSKPKPTHTPQPTNPPAAKWTWTARLVGPGEEGQQCYGIANQMIRVTVLDAAGNQISGVWIYESYSDQHRVTGHKGDDPFWGPGEAEFNGITGGRMCIATSEGGACESDFTRDLPCHDPPPLDDLWAAGYCECCEDGITKERCQELFESGHCLGVGHYMWRLEFKRSH